MTNIGSLDRAVRLVAGLALIAFTLLPPLAGLEVVAGLGVWRWVLAAAGVVLLLTAVVRVCPAYLPFGWDTRGRP